MTITTLLQNFRAALVVLVPRLEKVGIAWQRPDAYDEWDDIARTLFERLVVDVLRWDQPETLRQRFRLPSYDLLLQTYSGLAALEVVHPSLPQGRWQFHAFGTVAEPLDVIEVLQIDEDGRLRSNELTKCPMEGSAFYLRLDWQFDLVADVEIADS